MIRMTNVEKTYENGTHALNGISFEIQDGEFVFLVGPSGSGKSTIARLIASLWDVKDGAIELGGVDIRTLPLAECTKRIAYVSQDNYLFDLSVIDNIRMGRKGATDEEVIDAAKKCGCHAFIMGLENGYQTVCGASGGHLSGGERQRVYLAMALAQGGTTILLDEPGAFLDVRAQFELLDLLRSVAAGGKAVVLVMHELPQAMQYADRIALLGGGRLLGCDTSAALAATGAVDRVFGVRLCCAPDGVWYVKARG